MIYVAREKLSVIELKEATQTINFFELEELLWDRPSNIIYVELNGKIWGIVSYGDIVRANQLGDRSVNINRNFSMVNVGDSMKAREIFRAQENINALPVVDELGYLMGEYTRWDDFIALKNYNESLNSGLNLQFYSKNSRIALVKPSKIFKDKNIFLNSWETMLVSSGIKEVKVVERREIEEVLNEVDYVLFTDENELRGTVLLFSQILNKKLSFEKFNTYKLMDNEKIEENFLKLLKASGVNILTLTYKDTNTDKFKKMSEDVRNRFNSEGLKISDVLIEKWYKDFFGEMYSEEYSKDVSNLGFEICNIDGISKLKDKKSEYLNVIDGERLTVNQPKECLQTIYFFGPCVMVGERVEDKHTIESLLQNKLNNMGYRIKVCNYGCWGDNISQLTRIANTKLRENDIVIFYANNKEYKGIPNFNLASIIDKKNIQVEYFTDHLLHGNYIVNEILTDEIYDQISTSLIKSIDEERNEIFEKTSVMLTQSYIDMYFQNIDLSLYKNIGAIVMNCNPFTYGHRYLIEEALKIVDFLIIFVVEENKSLFSFSERYSMVCAGMADIKNVMVVPSGYFILSKTTFPEYFMKILDEDIVRNVEYDIGLFAKQIAPKLNISYRFVGEELEDEVTNEYNLAMKRILPGNGIKLVEIPRKKIEDKIISASRARKILENKCEENLEKFVPNSTMDILNYSIS